MKRAIGMFFGKLAIRALIFSIAAPIWLIAAILETTEKAQA
jgi:hypothetical protein